MKSTSSERRGLPRFSSRVIHRHRIGSHGFRRVSDLIFVKGVPYAVLEWINLSGIRTPIYLPLDAAKLRSKIRPKNTYYYDGTTIDPRFEDY